jgi:hypothetical protein
MTPSITLFSKGGLQLAAGVAHCGALDGRGIEQLFRFKVWGRRRLDVVVLLPLEERFPRIHQPFVMELIRRGFLKDVLAQGYVPTKTVSPSVPSTILGCQLIGDRSYFSVVLFLFVCSLLHLTIIVPPPPGSDEPGRRFSLRPRIPPDLVRQILQK